MFSLPWIHKCTLSILSVSWSTFTDGVLIGSVCCGTLHVDLLGTAVFRRRRVCFPDQAVNICLSLGPLTGPLSVRMPSFNHLTICQVMSQPVMPSDTNEIQMKCKDNPSEKLLKTKRKPSENLMQTSHLSSAFERDIAIERLLRGKPRVTVLPSTWCYRIE